MRKTRDKRLIAWTDWGWEVYAGIAWWLALMVTTIALPLLACMVSLRYGRDSMTQVVIFIATCWVCTATGAWLVGMLQPKIHHGLWWRD